MITTILKIWIIIIMMINSVTERPSLGSCPLMTV